MYSKNRVLLATLTALSATALAGCGSANRTVSTSSFASSASGTSTRSTGGRLTLKITWPKAKTRLIPAATTDIQLQVISQIGIFTDTGVNTKTVDVTQGTPSITVANVPAGPCLVQAFAIKKNADGTQITLATLDVPQSVNITANTDNPVSLILDPSLNYNTATVNATIQKALNADGSPVAANDPAAQPQMLTNSSQAPFTNLQDGAVYAITASASLNTAPNTPLPIPASAFTLSTTNFSMSTTTPFLTPTDANGNPLTTPAVGNVAYFKVSFAAYSGTLTAALSSDYGSPYAGLSSNFTLSIPPLYTQTTLASFSIGSYVNNVLLALTSSGNLYGAARNGGDNGAGYAFEVVAGSQTVTTIASFNYNSLYYPANSLVQDSSGNLYGVASNGGTNGDGAIFEIAAGTNTITPLAYFDNTTGYQVDTGLTIDSHGNLFGTTTNGGPNGYGTVFELAAGSSTITPLMASNNYSGYSNGLLAVDQAGNIYGRTSYFTNNGGTIFEIVAGTATVKTLASMTTGYLIGGVTLDSAGNLYGVTSNGGINNAGTIYMIAAGTNNLVTAASFPSNTGFPSGQLTIDSHGNIFGTTSDGGANYEGTVFELAAGANQISTVFTFNGSNGSNPGAYLTIDSAGNLYGTASGGSNNTGMVFDANPDQWCGSFRPCGSAPSVAV